MLLVLVSPLLFFGFPNVVICQHWMNSLPNGRPASFDVIPNVLARLIDYSNAPLHVHNKAIFSVPGPRVPFVQDDPKLASCFIFSKDCIMLGSIPFERRIDGEEIDCARMCVDLSIFRPDHPYQCRAFNFDRIRQLCDLFTHTGRHSPATLNHYKGVNYYELINQRCRTSTERAASNRDWNNLSGNIGATTAGTITVPLPVTFATKKVSISMAAEFSPEPVNDCPFGNAAVFIRTDGFELMLFDFVDETFFDLNEDECIRLCFTNGESIHIWINCSSLVYNIVSFECTIYSERSDLLGFGGPLIENVETVYWEKLCLPEPLINSCPSAAVFERIPNMVIKKDLNHLVATIETFRQCLELCLDARESFHFVCLSGQFYDKLNENCILNTINHLDNHEVLIANSEMEQVDYFSVSVCTPRSVQSIFEPTDWEQRRNVLTNRERRRQNASMNGRKLTMMRQRLHRLRQFRSRRRQTMTQQHRRFHPRFVPNL